LGDSVLHVKDGAQIPLWIQMPIEKEDARLMQQSMNDQLQMSMIIQDNEGDLGSTEMSIPIQRDTTNYAIQRLSLMHFPVQKATLDRQGRNAIDAFLQDLEDNASISIMGYSDNLGNAQSNLELSKERAETVYKYIRSIKPKSNIVKVNGLGSTALPPGIRSHELPESRFLSRTVQIEIIRTWKNLE
jgi:outer membrane protein OmpA-like peptidoglycan-associated protein